MNRTFVATLEEWYIQNGRDLPWRHVRDPYLIWISEIILQQTRVAQGMDYYHRFVERFPDFVSLAAAPEDEVMRLWQGLGYYSRARNLHAAARQVARRGSFPTDYAGVRALPGVGEYTAAAICSFAYGQPYAVLDGNVFRVLSRCFLLDAPIDTTPGRRLFRAMADEMLDTSRPALYNQAIMDFGAMQCVPASPSCAACPLAGMCGALHEGRVDELPLKARSVSVRDRYLLYIYLRDPQGNVWLRRRPKGDIWQGLYELYAVETDAKEGMGRIPDIFRGMDVTRCAEGVKHQLTHQTLHADCYLIEVGADRAGLDGLWVPEQELDRYPMPKLMLRLLEAVRRHMRGNGD